MTGLFSRVIARMATGLSVFALAAGLSMTAPTQAKADATALAAGAVLVAIVLKGAKKPKHKVIARYCHSHKTGLYHSC